jgi:hypothetical protein
LRPGVRWDWRHPIPTLARCPSGDVLLTRAGGGETRSSRAQSARGGTPARTSRGATLSLRAGWGATAAPRISRGSTSTRTPPCRCLIVTSDHRPRPGRTPPVRANEGRPCGDGSVPPPRRPHLGARPIAARPAGHVIVTSSRYPQSHRPSTKEGHAPVSPVGNAVPGHPPGKTTPPGLRSATRLDPWPHSTGVATASPDLHLGCPSEGRERRTGRPPAPRPPYGRPDALSTSRPGRNESRYIDKAIADVSIYR